MGCCSLRALLVGAFAALALLHFRANVSVRLQLQRKSSGRWGVKFTFHHRGGNAIVAHEHLALQNFLEYSSISSSSSGSSSSSRVPAGGGESGKDERFDRTSEEGEADAFDDVEIESLSSAHNVQRAHERGAVSSGAHHHNFDPEGDAAPELAPAQAHLRGGGGSSPNSALGGGSSTRKHALDYAAVESRLFTLEVGPESTSSCALDNPPVPNDLLEPVEWVPCPTPTFVSVDRASRVLDITCAGEVKVNFVNRCVCISCVHFNAIMPALCSFFDSMFIMIMIFVLYYEGRRSTLLITRG